MDFKDILNNRRSVKSYVSKQSISDEDLEALFEEVILSPSSFNLQHWKFIAVKDIQRKKQVQESAWGQEQVSDCSVLLIVCGKVDAYLDAPEIYSETPKEIQEKVLPMIHGFYDGQGQLQRDEAIRSASLASMTLMLAAKNRGWVTCPMIGFDPISVSKFAELDSSFIPVMLIALGYQKDEPRPRSYRRPVSEVVRWNTLNGSGLGE